MQGLNSLADVLPFYPIGVKLYPSRAVPPDLLRLAYVNRLRVVGA